mmetsp:Transcript_23210/g.51550  ORF Transcript_23210/g.51550 Transcript_23210/m.51550 type:complete len:295 (-) Transcript_23210:249-1133(-)
MSCSSPTKAAALCPALDNGSTRYTICSGNAPSAPTPAPASWYRIASRGSSRTPPSPSVCRACNTVSTAPCTSYLCWDAPCCPRKEDSCSSREEREWCAAHRVVYASCVSVSAPTPTPTPAPASTSTSTSKSGGFSRRSSGLVTLPYSSEASKDKSPASSKSPVTSVSAWATATVTAEPSPSISTAAAAAPGSGMGTLSMRPLCTTRMAFPDSPKTSPASLSIFLSSASLSPSPLPPPSPSTHTASSSLPLRAPSPCRGFSAGARAAVAMCSSVCGEGEEGEGLCAKPAYTCCMT